MFCDLGARRVHSGILDSQKRCVLRWVVRRPQLVDDTQEQASRGVRLWSLNTSSVVR